MSKEPLAKPQLGTCPDCGSQTGKRGYIEVPPKNIGSVASFGYEKLCTNKWHDVEPLAKPDESGREKAEHFFRNDPRFRGKDMPPYTDGEMASIKERQGLINGVDVFEFAHLHAESIKRETVRETVERCYKLSCHYCAENAEATFLFGAWRHLTKETSRGIPCAASAIRSAFEKGE